MKNKKILGLIFFIGSPFFSIPIIFNLIYNKTKLGLSLLTLLFGLIGYMYIPHVNNDKARYFLEYINTSNYSFSDFIDNLFLNPNIFYNFSLSFFSASGFSFQVFYFFMTSFVVGGVLYLFYKLLMMSRLSRKDYFVCFILLLLSFSLPNLLSGTKFYLGTVLLLLSFYTGLVQKKKISGLLFLTLSFLTHFSLIIFVPIYFLLKIFPNKTTLFRTVFVLSFIFLLVPKGVIYNFIQTFGFSEAYSNKIDLYLVGEDFVEQGLEKGGASKFIVYLFSILWVYAAYVYLIFKQKLKSEYRNIAYLVFAAINLFYTVSFVFSRYLVLGAMVIALLLISESRFLKTNKYVYLFIFLFALNWTTDLIILRVNIIESFFNIEAITLVTIFMQDQMTLSDLLR